MKSALTILYTFLITAISQAQSLAINTDGSTANNSAMLDIKSSSKGMLIPRLTSIERNAIPAPADGLVVYDTNTKGFWYHNGTSWIDLVNSSDNYWRKLGNNIYNSNTGNVGMGTLVPLAKLHVAEANVLFSAFFGPALPTPGNVPVSSTGRRAFWYVDKAAFRTGYVTSTFWDKDSIGNYSFAAGNDVKAKGQYSAALGWNNSATGDAAMSLGMFNTSSGGFGAFTAGFNNQASGNAAIAIGGSNIASQDNAIALGYFNTANASTSIAAGYSSQATAQYAVAIGNSVNASGQSSTSFGESNISSGVRSFTANLSNTASGMSSAAFGTASIAKAFNGFSIGTYNDDADNPNPVVEAPSDRIFQIGNGYSNFGSPLRLNALTVLRNGNVGIGSTNPVAPLEFAANVYGKKITLLPAGIGDCGFGVQPNLLQVYTNFNLHDIAFGTGTSGSFTENIRFTGTGNIGVGTPTPVNRLSVVGMADISGSLGIGIVNPGFPLNFATALGDKISLYGNSGAHYGFGIQGGLLQIHSGTSVDDIAFGYGSSNSFTERMRIKGSGAVGIGIINPSYILEINGRSKIYSGGSNATSAGIWFNNNANTTLTGFVGMENDNSIGFYGTGTPNGWGMVMEISTGNVGIGTSSPAQKLHVLGNILATGTITPSDYRYKKNIHPLENALAKLQQLNGVTYEMNRQAFPEWNFEDTRQYGLIAQEAEKIFPEIVKTIDTKGYKGVDYVKLIPVLVEAIKEQQKQIVILKEQNLQQQLQIESILKIK
jgi:hypothetical protein